MSDSKLEAYTNTLREICGLVTKQDLAAVLEYFDEECVVVNGASGDVGGKSSLLQGFHEMFATFPDWTPRVAASFVEGDTVGVLFRVSGTAAGAKSKATWIGTGFSTFDPGTGKIVRDVYYMDEAALEIQIAGAN